MSISRILVIQTAYIGDVILTTPLVRALAEMYPEAAIDTVTTPLSAGIFLHSPHVRRRLRFNKRRRKLPHLARLILHCRREGYDLSLSVQTSLTSALLAFLGGVPERVGFSVQPLTTRSVEYRETGPQHRRRRILSLLEALRPGAHPDDATELFVSSREREVAAEALETAPEGAALLGLAPGSVRATKRWPEESWVELLRSLRGLPMVPVLIGGNSERPLCGRIAGRSGIPEALNLAGRTTLLESAAVIERLDLMLSGDSAPLHMANAVGTPVFAFFGPTVREYGFFPFGPEDRVFEVDLECRPCSLHGGRRCPLGHHRCMRDIDVRQAAESVRARLSSAGGRG